MSTNTKVASSRRLKMNRSRTLARALLRGAARSVSRMRRAAAARRDARALMSMPPDMLKDIGIAPGEIDWLVRNGRTDRHGDRW